MKYLAVFSDFDGTLYRDDYSVSQENRKEIKNYIANGGKFIISTGRLFASIYPHLVDLDLHGEVITTQGAEIYNIDNKKLVWSSFYSNEQAVFVMKYVESQQNVTPMCYIDNQVYAKEENEPIKLFSKIVGLQVNFVGENLTAYLQKSSKSPSKILAMCNDSMADEFIQKCSNAIGNDYEVCKSQSFLIEILTAGVNKGSAVKYLCQKYGWDKSKIICIGDSGNDNSMIEYAGLGVAVGNAFDQTKKVADYISETNDNDGVAKTIRRFCYE